MNSRKSIFTGFMILLLGHGGIASSAFPAFIQQADTIQAGQLTKKAIKLAQSGKYDSAIYYFEQAAPAFSNAGAWDRFFYVHTQCGNLLNVMYKYAESSSRMEKTLRQHGNRLTPNLSSYQIFYGVLTWSYFQQLNYEKALYYLYLLDFGAQQNPDVEPARILYSKYYQGVIYQRIGQYDKALKLMLLTKDLSKKFANSSYISRTYNNLGIIYRNLGEYERALEFYKKALALEKGNRSEVSLTPIYNNIGRIYFYLKKYDTALKELDYALNVLKNSTDKYYSVESSLINSKALVLIELGDFREAESILKEVLGREITSKGNSWPGSSPTLKGLGLLYARTGAYAQANEYLNLSIEVLKPVIDKKNDKLAELYNMKAGNYLQLKDFDQALRTIQQSLISLTVDFDKDDYVSNPGPEAIILDKVELIESLYRKAEILLALFNETGEPDYLDAAKAANENATRLVEKVRKNMLYESSKMNLSQKAKTIYEQAIAIALMSDQEDSGLATSEIFAAMENSKAYLLSEAVEKAKALGYSNLSESVLHKEDSFRTRIKVLERQRSNILLHDNDSIELDKINRELFVVKEQLESLKEKTIDQGTRYQHLVLSLANVQSALNDNTLIIEYFAGKEGLYAIGIDRSGAQVYKLGNLELLLNEFAGTMKQVQQMKAADYQQQAYEVYKQVLAPILTGFSPAQNLVIIPDKQLGVIPFSALVSHLAEEPAYNNLPYLLHEYTITQHQTVALYLDRGKQPKVRPEGSFIGFAPDFNEDDLQEVAKRQLRNQLQPLPFAKVEVETIADMLAGERAIGTSASEANFKVKAPGYSILHLATHAIIDMNNPIYSKLIFDFSDTTKNEDGELHSFEIYSLRLNCDLVTLSACNTGTGKFHDGEGIYSLGRSFLMAGAGSVLTSLWEVSDRSTSQIMESFYARIKQGQSTPESLRLAKRDYLDGADPLTANPHYWAAFVYIGQPAVIYNSTFPWYWVGAGVLLAGLILVVFILPRQRS